MIEVTFGYLRGVLYWRGYLEILYIFAGGEWFVLKMGVGISAP